MISSKSVIFLSEGTVYHKPEIWIFPILILYNAHNHAQHTHKIQPVHTNTYTFSSKIES
jgi:hypothetical protein